MTVTGWQMNRFERILFGIALVLGALVLVVRVGAMGIGWYLHHIR
jgi:hypothetical protein